jgi:hypothetical protein
MLMHGHAFATPESVEAVRQNAKPPRQVQGRRFFWKLYRATEA